MTARLSVPTVFLATLLAVAGSAARAQSTSAPAAPAAAAPAPAGEAAPPLVETAPATKTKDARIEHLVTEDSQVRIEETRVRGVTKKIVVHSKIPGVGSYEIQPRDPSVDPENDRAAGMRLFNFNFGS
jgi:outer membrane receptor protein involved in Fe transport